MTGSPGSTPATPLATPPATPDRSWPFWPVVPLYPYGQRPTLRQEVIPNTLWTFDQLQGILYVVTPIRMTVVKLAAGGLLVYAPVAPTPECVALLNELVAVHGDVRYIILPTVSGIEHKVFVGPFARRYPMAQVFVSPHQWSWPLNLPLSWLGLPRGRTQVLPIDSQKAPFGDEFDYAILGPIQLGVGPFEEVAMLHRASGSLLITDAVISIPAAPPAIVQLDPYPLLYHSRNSAAEAVQDSPERRQTGWQRVAMFSLYFQPQALKIAGFVQSIRDCGSAPDRSRKAYFGWYPYDWQPDWEQSFAALCGGERLVVAPILQQLILNRDPQGVIEWSDRVAAWSFERVVCCHFAAPVAAGPAEFRQAFAFLEQHPQYPAQSPLPDPDFALLQAIDAGLGRTGITPPRQDRI
jgi:Domain of unknown function (DUF4336)